MSLVNEALKKARLEAARQDAARRGLPLPGAQPPTGRRIAGPILIRIGLVLFLVVAATLLFFAGRFTSDPAAESDGSQLAAVPPATAPASASAANESGESSPAAPDLTPTTNTSDQAGESSGAGVAPAAPAEPQPRSTEPSARVESRPAPEPPTRTEPPAAGPLDRASRVRVRSPLESSPAGSTPEPPRRASPPAETRPVTVSKTAAAIRTEVRTLELPGSRKIELGGIAWSEDRPFALINGRVVGPGDTIESLTVVNIEPRAVELEGDAGHFLLRLK